MSREGQFTGVSGGHRAALGAGGSGALPGEQENEVGEPGGKPHSRERLGSQLLPLPELPGAVPQTPGVGPKWGVLALAESVPGGLKGWERRLGPEFQAAPSSLHGPGQQHHDCPHVSLLEQRIRGPLSVWAPPGSRSAGEQGLAL